MASLVTTATNTCNKKSTGNCLKGRLEVKAPCMNYTISVVQGSIDTSLVEAQWTDEHTGKRYHNAFGLASRCNFPADIKEGDEFYFTIDSVKVQNCVVCLIYYPTPAKKLFITVSKVPCH